MKPIITKQWLDMKEACADGQGWWSGRCGAGDPADVVVARLIEDGHLRWANQGLCRCLSRENRVRYALHCARGYVAVFEGFDAVDNRPRFAICAIERYLRNPCRVTKGWCRIAARTTQVAFREARNDLAKACARAISFAALCAAKTSYKDTVNYAACAGEGMSPLLKDMIPGNVQHGLALLKGQA